jgi:hypothetical protein
MSTVKGFFSAGLLTIAVIGGVGSLLVMSLRDPQPQPAAETATAHTTTQVIETVTVTGDRRAI